jgi:hypothetical protein
MLAVVLPWEVVMLALAVAKLALVVVLSALAPVLLSAPVVPWFALEQVWEQ